MKKIILYLVTFCCIPFMHSQIVFTSTNDTLKIPFGAEDYTLKEFDLNDDGVIDTEINWNSFDFAFQFSSFPEVEGDGPGFIYTWATETYYGYTIPTSTPLMLDEMIDETSDYYHPNLGPEHSLTNIDYAPYYESDNEFFHWPTTDHYIGIKFKVGDNWHYGWIQAQRIVLEEPEHLSRALVIKGFAAESAPNTPIAAGDTENDVSLNTDAITQDNSIIFPNPFSDKITISNLPFGTHCVSVLTIEGKLVKSHTVSNENKLDLDLSQSDPQVYIVEILDSDGSILSREKILKIQN